VAGAYERGMELMVVVGYRVTGFVTAVVPLTSNVALVNGATS